MRIAGSRWIRYGVLRRRSLFSSGRVLDDDDDNGDDGKMEVCKWKCVCT